MNRHDDEPLEDKEHKHQPSVPLGEHEHGHLGAEVHNHNREVNEGLKNNKERLVDIGRGEQTKGRGTS